MDSAGHHAPRERDRAGGLWRHRDFRLLWFGETISGVGTAMAVVAMPLLAVTVLHAGTFTVGVLVAAGWLPWLLVGLPAGAWVDRLPSRMVMVTCDVFSTVMYASVPVAAWLGVLTVGQLIAVELLGGASGVFFSTGYQVTLPSLISADELVEGNAKLQGSASAAQLGGPGLAGLAAHAFGVVTALVFNAASFLVSAACLLGIRAPAPPSARPSQSRPLRADIAEGVRLVAGDRYLRPMGLGRSPAGVLRRRHAGRGHRRHHSRDHYRQLPPGLHPARLSWMATATNWPSQAPAS